MNHLGERTFTSTEAGAPQPAIQPLDELARYLRDYAHERPEVVAMWAFGLGFLLGWRLKPW